MAKTQKITVTIADTIKLAANRAIDATWQAYSRKNGLKDEMAKLEGKIAETASHIFGLAVTANKLAAGQKEPKNASPSWTEAYFLEMCKAAETHLKEKLGNVENLAKEFPIWSVYKSEIKRAIQAGLLPVNFSTYGAMKEARKAHDKAGRESTEMRTGERSGTDTASGGATGEGTNVAEAMGAAKVSPALAATLRIMQGAIAGMDAETQDAFASELSKLVAKYGQKEESKAAQKDKVDAKAAQAA